MRALDRKLFRDLARLRMQAIAIGLVVAAAVALFVGMLATYRSLRVSEHHYYTAKRFAHVWSDLSRAPQSITRAILAIPGVSAVEGRVQERAILDVPGLDEPASALLVSIPPTAGHALNDLHVRRGRHVEAGHSGEVLVSEAFAERNHLALGDTMNAVVSGRVVRLRFVGVALSPEYVMPVPPSGLTPDDRRFAVLWMAHDELASLVDLRGAINEVAVRLAPGTDERAVIVAIDRVLEPYGGRGAYGRESQASHTMLEEHIQQIGSLALLLPTIFLLVAAFLINIVLSRVVTTQREQIGLLKAFGYGSAQIALHYLELTVLIVIGGIVLGLPLGAWLGRVTAAFYAGFFRFPVLVFRIEAPIIAASALVAVIAAGLGALGSVLRVAAMPPIVAMTPEVPAFHTSLIDRAGMSLLLAPSSRMVMRNVARRPLRSALALAGMSLAVAVVVLGSSSADSIERMRDVRFQAAQREDLSVSLGHARALGTVRDFLALPGVIRAEPYRVVPGRVTSRGRTQDVTIFGLRSESVLRKAVDNGYAVVPIPSDGAVVGAWLAKRFDLHRGDPVSLEIRENRRRVITTRVVDVIDEPLGVSVYLDLETLGRLLGEPATYSAANLTVDDSRARDLYAALKRMPAAMAVDLRRGALASYRTMSDSAVNFVRKIEVVFAVIIAFGVVYNSAKIALAERGRELATLRVLGLTRREVAAILLGEVGVLAALAVPLGFVIGDGLAALVARAMSTQRMHVPHVVAASTFAFGLVVFVTASAVSALVVRRGLDHLDLIGVLKARE